MEYILACQKRNVKFFVFCTFVLLDFYSKRTTLLSLSIPLDRFNITFYLKKEFCCNGHVVQYHLSIAQMCKENAYFLFFCSFVAKINFVSSFGYKFQFFDLGSQKNLNLLLGQFLLWLRSLLLYHVKLLLLMISLVLKLLICFLYFHDQLMLFKPIFACFFRTSCSSETQL